MAPMTLVNTSTVPDATVRRMLQQLLEATGPDPVAVQIYTCQDRPFEGLAFPGLREVSVGIGPASLFPYERPEIDPPGYRALRLFSAEQALFYTLAHELRHLWQWWHPTHPRLDGGNVRLSDADADLWALAQMERLSVSA